MKISGGIRRILIDLVVIALIGVAAWFVLFRVHAPRPIRGIESIELTLRPLWDPLSPNLEDWQVIGGSRDILWIPPGQLVVSDSERSRVIRFDTSGELIEIIGRSGEGPGEFGEPWDLAYDEATSTLWVGDRGTWRMSLSYFHLSATSSEFIDRISARQFRIQSNATLTLTESDAFWIVDPFQWRTDLKRIHHVRIDGTLIAHFGEIYRPEGMGDGSVGRSNEGLLEIAGRDSLVFLWESRPLLEVWSTQGELLLEKPVDLPEVVSNIEYVDWLNRSGNGPQGPMVGPVEAVCFSGVARQPSSGFLYVMVSGVARKGLTPMEPYGTLGIYAFDPRTMKPVKWFHLKEFSSEEFAPHRFVVDDNPSAPTFYTYDYANGVIVALEPREGGQ